MHFHHVNNDVTRLREFEVYFTKYFNFLEQHLFSPLFLLTGDRRKPFYFVWFLWF